jgi:hypothetical protein
MGNTIVNYDHITFMNFSSKQKYFYEIQIEEFNIEEIKKKLVLLNCQPINNSLDNIIFILNYIQQNETIEILCQIDGYIFEKYNGLPFLKIENINAKKHRKYNNVSENTYYYICNLTKTFKYQSVFNI